MVVCEYGVGECVLFEQRLRDDDQCFLIVNKYHENTQTNNVCIVLLQCAYPKPDKSYSSVPQSSIVVQKHTNEPY